MFHAPLMLLVMFLPLCCALSRATAGTGVPEYPTFSQQIARRVKSRTAKRLARRRPVYELFKRIHRCYLTVFELNKKLAESENTGATRRPNPTIAETNGGGLTKLTGKENKQTVSDQLIYLADLTDLLKSAEIVSHSGDYRRADPWRREAYDLLQDYGLQYVEPFFLRLQFSAVRDVLAELEAIVAARGVRGTPQNPYAVQSATFQLADSLLRGQD